MTARTGETRPKRTLLGICAGLLLFAAPRRAEAQIHVLVPEDPRRERSAYTATVLEEFNVTMAEWRAAWEADDAQRIARLYTTDAALLLPAGESPVRGREQIRGALGGLLPCSGGIRTGVEDFHVNGEMAYALGRFEYERGGAAPVAGTYVAVLEYQGRRWLIRSQLFRSELPAEGTAACGGTGENKEAPR
ncbi:MAG: nuclear transport factor 2 family protein [Gemmatimonadetes bacterium]|nr:nuclear transport factor 2 family protein [Gemmatimonadota bacterium]